MVTSLSLLRTTRGFMIWVMVCDGFEKRIKGVYSKFHYELLH